MHVLYIEILGFSIKLETNCEFAFKNLSKDFALFSKGPSTAGESSITLCVLSEAPPYQRVPTIDASFYALGFICYNDRNINYVVYSCDSLLIYDFDKEKGEIFGKDDFFIYEKARLVILSRLGELLDKKGIHRMHAFGVAYNEKNLICLLPMEGGKTTTTLNLLKSEPKIRIIADDICFIDQHGEIYPFILRVGARSKELIEGIPEEFINEINRPYYGVKYFIDPGFFKDRLSTSTQVTHILVGKRTFRQETTVQKISKFQCIGPLFENGIFGRGLPNLLEFFIRGDSRSFGQRVIIIIKRVYSCVLLLVRSKTYIIKIGRSKDLTIQEILKFLRSEGPKG